MVPEDTFAAILEAVAAGEPVRDVLVELKVERRKFYAALKDEEHRTRYARAKVLACSAIADDILELADQNPKVVPVYDQEGNLVEHKIDTAFERWRQTRIDSRKWALAKLLPKVYGDKLELDGRLNVGDALIERLARGKARSGGDGDDGGGEEGQE